MKLTINEFYFLVKDSDLTYNRNYSSKENETRKELGNKMINFFREASGGDIILKAKKKK